MGVLAEFRGLKAPEIRTFGGLELRESEVSESGRYLEGRAVPYGAFQDVGWYMERIKKGCFRKSIREAGKELPLLLFHDSRSFPVGVSEKWTENDDGLDCVWRLDSSDMAQEAARLARDGMLTGLSVGFAPILDDREFDAEKGIAYVTRVEARLLEVSLTPTPAYVGAKVSLVRSRERTVSGVPAAAVDGGGSGRRSAEMDGYRRFLAELDRV